MNNVTTPPLSIALVCVSCLLAVFIGAGLVANPFLAIAVAMFPVAIAATSIFPVKSRGVQNLFCLLGMIFLFGAMLWPRYAYVRLGGSIGVTPTRIVLAFCVLSLLVYLIKDWRFRARLTEGLAGARWIVIGLVIFFFSRLISAGISDAPLASMLGFANEFTFFGIVFLLFVVALSGQHSIEKTVAIFPIIMSVVVVVGLVEWYKEYNVFSGLVSVSDDYMREATLSKIRAEKYRIQAMSDHPLTYAQFLACAVPILISVALTRSSRITQILIAMLVVLAFISLWMTGSRAGVGAALLTIFLMWCMATIVNAAKHRIDLAKLILLIFGLGVAAIGIIILFDGALDFLSGKSSAEISSTSARLLMLERAVPLVYESPLFGHGVNRAAELIGYVGSRGVLTVDSLLISFAVESGTFALLAYLFTMFSGIATALRVARRVEGERHNLIIAFAASILAFLMTSVVLSLTSNLYFLAFVLAAIVVMAAEVKRA